MSEHFFDYDDGDFAYTVSDNMAIDSDGNMMMRMGDNMAMDMDSGELHIISYGMMKTMTIKIRYNRAGGCPLAEQPTSHTTVRTVRYTAVQS